MFHSAEREKLLFECQVYSSCRGERWRGRSHRNECCALSVVITVIFSSINVKLDPGCRSTCLAWAHSEAIFPNIQSDAEKQIIFVRIFLSFGVIQRTTMDTDLELNAE